MKRGFISVEFVIAIVITLVIIGAVTFSVLQPRFEAEAFNRCTGGNATYATALFTELRVENCNQ